MTTTCRHDADRSTQTDGSGTSATTTTTTNNNNNYKNCVSSDNSEEGSTVSSGLRLSLQLFPRRHSGEHNSGEIENPFVQPAPHVPAVLPSIRVHPASRL